MFNKSIELITKANKVLVVQAENPDGDSLGSALALEEILSDLNKDVILYSYVEIPKYLRYFGGWDRVDNNFDVTCDMAIIVDTSSDTLIAKIFELPGGRHFLESKPVVVLDHHHKMDSTLSFDHELVSMDVVASSQIVYSLALSANWTINQSAAQNMYGALVADTLGFTTQNLTAGSFLFASKLIEIGAVPSELDSKRKEFSKKSQEILAYKGRLLERVEYYLDGRLALIHIPWEEIKQYSDQYNPSVLVIDEMRLVIGVEIAVAIKTYPDGRLTGKLRSNMPICTTIAGFFGGGGHPYTSGFRTYENYDNIKSELLDITEKTLNSQKYKASNEAV